MAEDAAHNLDGEARDAVIAVLQELDSENLALNSALVEALAAYGLITPVRDLEQIATEIDEVLAAPPDEEAAKRARSIVSSRKSASSAPTARRSPPSIRVSARRSSRSGSRRHRATTSSPTGSCDS